MAVAVVHVSRSGGVMELFSGQIVSWSGCTATLLRGICESIHHSGHSQVPTKPFRPPPPRLNSSVRRNTAPPLPPPLLSNEDLFTSH